MRSGERGLLLDGAQVRVGEVTILMSILGWLTSGPLDRIFKTIDTSIDNETGNGDTLAQTQCR